MNSFETHMKEKFGCGDEIIANWISFAKECVEAEQYADYIPAPEDEAIEKWLKQIYATLCLVKAEGGDDLANIALESTNEHCLYPEEIAGLLQLLTEGIAPVNLIEKSLEGELETTSSFEKAYNVKHIQSLDYDEADEYFSDYECRFNKTPWVGTQGMM